MEDEAISLTLQVFDPAGQSLSTAEEWTTGPSQKMLSWVSHQAGEYRVEMRGLGEGGAAGSYTAVLVEQRSAVTGDEDRVAAERFYSAAYRLRLEKTPESLRAAISKFEQSLACWQRAGDPEGSARTLNAIGYAYRLLGDYAQALVHYAEAVPLWRSAEEAGGETDTLDNMGYAAQRLGQHEQAIEHFQEALTSAAGDPARKARVLNNLALSYAALGGLRHGAGALPRGDRVAPR